MSNDQKICKQVEFYFSDSNLPYNKFLWTIHKNSEGGWIPIETIAGFKKIKMISDDLGVIINALKKNPSDIYELDAKDKNIRRKTEVVEQDHTARSIYIKGLPLIDKDAKDPEAALFQLQERIDEAFSQQGKVLCVRLKKTHVHPKKFKGSAFVELETPEQAKKIADLKELDIDGHKVTITYKPAYLEMKSEIYKDTAPNKHRRFSFNAFKVVQASPRPSGVKRKSMSGFEAMLKKPKIE